MADTPYKDITLNGLWKNNPALVQLLGLCPLLAVTSSVVNAIGMGLATIMVLCISNLAVASIKHFVTDAVRLPVFVVIIAAAVTVIELLMQAFSYELYQVLGIFLPLITTNCVILGRAEAFAGKNSLFPAAVDGFMMGLGFALVLIIMGVLREFTGTGALFDNMQLVFGPMAADWKIVLIHDHPQLLISLLPPGAFIFAGFMIAFKNVVDKKLQDRGAARAMTEEPKVKTSRRVRVTAR